MVYWKISFRGITWNKNSHFETELSFTNTVKKENITLSQFYISKSYFQIEMPYIYFKMYYSSCCFFCSDFVDCVV